MEKLFELTFQDQTLNPQVGTFTDASQATGTFTLEDGEYYLTNGDTKGFYTYKPIALQSGLVDDSKVIIEFDLKVVTASVNTHSIIGTYAGVDGNGIPTGAKITLQYNNGDIELVLGSGATATLIESADVVVDQWYHFRIDCYLAAPLASTYQVKIDGIAVTTVTGATTDYALGVISVLGTDLHACDECGIKNITFVTETNLYVGRTALGQALQDVKGYVDNQVGACVPLAGSNQISGSLIPATDNAYDLGSSTYNFQYVNARRIRQNNLSEYLLLMGAPSWNEGASLSLFGKNLTTFGGGFRIDAHNGTDFKRLQGSPDGTLTWNNKNVAMQEDVIPLAGSNRISGSLIPSTDNSIDIGSSTKNIKMLYTKGITINGTQFLPSDYLPKTTTLESLASNSIPFHNAYPRCKYLGTTITDAQNTAIKNRTYDDLFIGDYWTINGVNWRIVAIDYYYNIGDTNFDKGNIIVMPDTNLYNAQMNSTNTTAGAYAGSLMRTQNLNSARTLAQNAFGSHLANHRILLANAVGSSGPSNWSWYDSDGVELPNEVQIYGTRAWGSALKGYDVATQKQQLPLLALAPQFVNIRQAYWLQDVSSYSVSSLFARVVGDGGADGGNASSSFGVRPSVTLSYI